MSCARTCALTVPGVGNGELDPLQPERTLRATTSPESAKGSEYRFSHCRKLRGRKQESAKKAEMEDSPVCHKGTVDSDASRLVAGGTANI